MNPDHELTAIARLQRGDIGGLEPLVRTYHARAVRCALLVVHDHALALDIAQAAFVRLMDCIGQFDPSRPFAPWFFKLVLRDARKAAERRARGALLEASASQQTASTGTDGPADRDPGPEDLWEQRELAQAVVAALAALPPAERVAIVQRYYLGLTEAEMATASRTPLGTIKWRLHAARQRLRPLLATISTD